MWLYKCKCFDLAKYIIYYNRSIPRYTGSIPRYTGSSVCGVDFYLHNMYFTLFVNKASSFIQTRVLYWLLISNLYRFPTMLDFCLVRFLDQQDWGEIPVWSVNSLLTGNCDHLGSGAKTVDKVGQDVAHLLYIEC